MNRLALKLFLKDNAPLDSAAFVLLFHRIIQDDLLPDDSPIDVVSYRHVHHGPWVQLICAEGQYVLDGRDGRPGLKYIARNRAVDLPGALQKLTAFAMIVERGLKLEVESDEMELELLDRKTYANTREGFARATGKIAPVIGELFEHGELAWAGAADLLGPMRLGLRTEGRSTLAALHVRARSVSRGVYNVA